MYSLQLKIDDSVFEKFMGLLDMLPKDKVSVSETKCLSIKSVDFFSMSNSNE